MLETSSVLVPPASSRRVGVPWLLAPALRFAPTRSPRCVLSGSSPQLLYTALRTSQRPVDREGVGVGCYLRCDPGGKPHEGGRQRLVQAEYSLQAGNGDLYSLPDPTPPLGWLRHQKDVHLGQGILQPLASVGQIPQELPRYSIPQSRLEEELLGQ